MPTRFLNRCNSTFYAVIDYHYLCQLVAGSLNGIEAITHGNRAFVDTHCTSSYVFLTIDARNNFNCIKHAPSLVSVAKKVPGLARFVQYTFSFSPYLLFGIHTISSLTGTQ